MDSVAQIILRAKDEASKTIAQVGKTLQTTQASSTQAARGMNATLALGANTARFALIGLSGAATFVGAALVALDGQLSAAAGGISAFTGRGIAGIPEVKKQLASLFGDNNSSVKTITEALKTVWTAFGIFDVGDPKAIAQILINWNKVTGQELDKAGSNFRRLILLYFGKDTDPRKALEETADKILAVAGALHLDPGSLSSAMADAGPLLSAAFGDFDNAIIFLASIGAAGGDVEKSAEAVKKFDAAVQKLRDARGKPPGEQPKDIVDAFAALGLSPETVNNEGKKLGDLMIIALKNAMKDKKLTPQEIDALGLLFGDQIGIDMALASGAISQFRSDAQVALKDYKDALKDAAAATDADVGSKIAKAWNGFLAALDKSPVFTNLGNDAAHLLDAMTGLLNFNFKDLKKSMGDLGSSLVGVSLKMAPAQTLLGFSLFDWLLGGSKDGSGGMPGKTGSGTISASLNDWWEKTVAPAIKTWWEGKKENKILPDDTNGIASGLLAGLMSLAPGASAAYLLTWWEDVKTSIKNFFADREITLSSIGSSVLKVLFAISPTALAARLKAWWDDDVWPTLKEFPSKAWEWIKDKLGSIGKSVIGTVFGATPEQLLAIMSTMWTAVSTAIGKAWETAKLGFGSFGSSIWDAIKTGATDAIAGAEGALTWAKNRLTDITTALEQWLEPVKTWAVGIWDSIKNGVTDAIKDSSTGVLKWAINRWADLKTGFDLWLPKAVELGANILKGIIQGISGAWDDLVKTVEKIGGGVLERFKKIFNIKSPSREMELIGQLIMQGLAEGFEKSKNLPMDAISAMAIQLTGQVLKMYDDLQAIHEGRSGASWAAFTTSSLAALDTVGIKTSDTTKAMLLTWAGYADSFRAYLDKFNGDILKAIGHTLVDIIEGEIIKVLVSAAAQVAIAAITAPLTLGASLLANAPILAASALGVAGLEALKASIPGYAVGTPFVPTDQLAMVHRGEMIVPKTFAEGVRRGDVALGTGGQGVIVQVILDGQMITEQVGRRLQDGVRSLVRADLRGVMG